MSKTQLYMKINQVMQDVEYLQKDDKVEFGNTKYKAIYEEKVTMTVRDSLIKNKLIIIPVEQDHSRDGTLSTVNTKYKIIDCETGEYETIVSSGTGADTQDKGVGKAMTYSYKYLLLRTFSIPTGEDPDKISSAELDEQQRKREEKKQETKNSAPTADIQITATIKAKYQAIHGSLDGLEEFVAEHKGNTEKVLTEKIAAKANRKGA